MVLENNIQTLNYVNSIKLNQEWQHWGINRSTTLRTATISTLTTESYNLIIILYPCGPPPKLFTSVPQALGSLCVQGDGVMCVFIVLWISCLQGAPLSSTASAVHLFLPACSNCQVRHRYQALERGLQNKSVTKTHDFKKGHKNLYWVIRSVVK